MSVAAARAELEEALRMLGIYTVNMLTYAREAFQASQPGVVRGSRLRSIRARGWLRTRQWVRKDLGWRR